MSCSTGANFAELMRLGEACTKGELLRSCVVLEHEADLLKRAADNDHEAFTSLFDLLAPTVLGLLVRILGSRAIAEEVLQDVFLQVWKQAHLYRPDLSSARGWLLLIARSRGLDRLRHERAAGRRDELAVHQERRVASPTQLANLVAHDRRQGLFDALMRLPVKQRVCIQLALFEGLSHSQIAQRLEAPLGTVKSRLRLGMMKIREVVEERDGRQAPAPHPDVRAPSIKRAGSG